MKGLQQSLYFFSRFLNDPHSVASVLPSSKELSQQMFQGMSFKPGDTILEYGPGTGSFTRIVHDSNKREANSIILVSSGIQGCIVIS